MSGQATNIFTQGNILPKYVSEETLKRARVDTEDGPAIRVETSNSTDLSPVTDALGTTEDQSTDNTVIGLLKNISDTNSTDLSPVTDTLGTTSDQSTDSTVIGLLKSIASKLQ